MSGRVTIRLPARRGGRPGPANGADGTPDAADSAPSPTPERIPRVARVLALAHHWQGLIRSGSVRDQADLARLVGVSRARVTQVLSLLWLAPDIQDQILHTPPLPWTEQELRELAREPRWARQLAALGLA